MAGSSGRRTLRHQESDAALQNLLTRLTWPDLKDWAGVSALRRGRSYAASDRVGGLAHATDGGVLAWVQGSRRSPYAVHLGSDPRRRKRSDRLWSRCSCPVGGSGCKHGVAVAVACMDALAAEDALPVAPPDDPRLELTQAAEEVLTDERPSESPTPGTRRLGRAPWSAAPGLRAFVRSQDGETLARWLCDVAADLPELATRLEAWRDQDASDLPALKRRLEASIATLSPEPDLEGRRGRHVPLADPDWPGLERALLALVAAGQADYALESVADILESAGERVAWDLDDFATSCAASRVLEVALGALPHCSMTPAEQILHAHRLLHSDDYELLPALDGPLAHCGQADWSEAADLFAAAAPAPGDEETWRRESRLRELEALLIEAGRPSEAAAVWEDLASTGGSPVPLIRRLLEAGRWEEAQRWALSGLERGVERGALDLHRLLDEALLGRGAWEQLAAHRAENFRHRPHRAGYVALCEAARKARALGAVRKGVRAFLDDREDAPRASAERWSLPPVPEPARLPPTKTNQPGVRLDVALEDGTPSEILRCFDAMPRGRRSGLVLGTHSSAVAAAVSKAHPERALEIYEAMVAHRIGLAKPSEYGAAVDLLHIMRPLDRRVGPRSRWRQRILRLREEHGRKWRLVELLDGLLGKPAAAAGRKPRGRRR